MAILECGNVVVAYRPSDRTINATQLLKSGSTPRTMLQQFFAKNPSIVKQVRRSHANTQGTYISFKDARILCTHFHLDSNPLERLIQLEAAAVGVHFSKGGSMHYGVSNDAALLGNGPGAAVPVPQGFDRQEPRATGNACFTQPGYGNGSYLAPAARSRLQPVNPQRSSAISPAACPVIRDDNEERGQGDSILGLPTSQGSPNET